VAKLRLGIIGAGSWTLSSHLPNLERHRDVLDFAIVNRRDPALLATVAERHGFTRATTDWHDVIAERPDIVVIGSPPGFHHEQAKAALEAGAHVLCEKPFTIDPADAWDLADTVARTGRQLFIAYGWNYRPMVVDAHRLMHEDGGVGQIEHVGLHMDSVTRELLSETGAYPDAAPESVPRAATWSRPETSGGGYGQAQLTHLLGISLWLTDLRGQDVFALMGAPLEAKVELHDAVTIRYEGGAIGTMSGQSSHVGAAGNRHAVEIRIVGSRGMFHLDLRDDVLWRYRGPDDDRRVALEPGAGRYDCAGPVDALVAAGLGGTPDNNSPAELGARTVEILAAAYRSAASGRLEPVRTGGR
jgi:predicted dehydrogenase